MYILYIALSIMLLIGILLPHEKASYVKKEVGDWQGLDKEMPTIIKAAERNNCFDDDFLILLSIRKAENGRSGREFGVLHPRCLLEIEKEPSNSLFIQACWAAATIVKNRQRWNIAGKPLPFIRYLGGRYCPPSADPQGYTNWIHNVNYWFEKYKQNGVCLPAGTAKCKSTKNL